MLLEGLQGLGIAYDEKAPEQLMRYYALLVDGNARMNLLGDAGFEAVLDRHFLDSLAPLGEAGLFPHGASLVDVGSGAGFPGLALAIARPDLQVLLVDTLAKRIGFLNEVISGLALSNVQTRHARAEDAAHTQEMREGFDIALARAVAGLPVLCELLLPFARVGGQMVCYKGPAAKEEMASAGGAALLLGGGELRWRPVPLPRQPQWQHCLVTCPKRGPTPPEYPRKAGLPGRKPLVGVQRHG